MTKYDPSSSYQFDCQISVKGTKASSVEKIIKNMLSSIIKEASPSFVSLSNECIDKKDKTVKIFRILEEL